MSIIEHLWHHFDATILDSPITDIRLIVIPSYQCGLGASLDRTIWAIQNLLDLKLMIVVEDCISW